MGIALVGACLVQAASQAPTNPAPQQAGLQPLSPVPSHDSSPRALLDRYCVSCHNQQVKTADLTLDTMDVENVSEGAE